MTDTKKKHTKNDSTIDERPLDPTRNAQDLIGDTTGLTGVTTGSPKQTSAEPSDKAQLEDTAHLPGGVKDFPGKVQTGTPPDATNSKLYNEEVQEGMSDTYKAKAEELASGEDDAVSGDQSARANDTASRDEFQDAPGNSSQSPPQGATGNTLPDESGQPVDDNVRKYPDAKVPSVYGEQSVSGDMPDPSSDDDTQANAQQAGTQIDENTNEEHPEEVDIARDIDKAEQWHREH